MSSTVVARAYERAGEPSRARYPDESGYAERDGVRLFWELYGTGDPTVTSRAGCACSNYSKTED